MSILSDIEIEELCTIPKFAVTSMVPSRPSPRHDVYMLPQEVITYEHLSEETLKMAIRNNQHSDVGVKSYRELTDEEKNTFADKAMLSPFVAHQVRVDENGNKLISYGLSSFGYDLRIADEFKIFTNLNSTCLDPKGIDKDSFVDFKGPICIIPPNSFILARSLERFNMPKDVSAIVVGKSTYARVGVNCLCTPAEAGWCGYLTIELANCTPLPVKVYANEGACQVIFMKGSMACKTSYADGNRKYQHQGPNITLPLV